MVKEHLVNNAEFKGKYFTRKGVNPNALPVPDKTGLWSVWKTSANMFIVQSIDKQNLPVGKLFELNEAQFNDLFLPASKKEEITVNAHNLIEIWYKQTCEQSAINVSTEQKEEKLALDSKHLHLNQEETSPLLTENPYGLPDSFRFSVQKELQKIAGEQKNPCIKTLTLLIEGKKVLPKDGEVNWHLPSSFTELGLSLRHEKHYHLALLCHNHALTLSPNDERILFNIARTEFEMGKQEESKQRLKQILAKNSDFTVARDLLAFLEGASNAKKTSTT